MLEGNNPRFPWVPFRVTLSVGLEAPRDLDVTATSTTSIHLDNPSRQEPATHETPHPHGAASVQSLADLGASAHFATAGLVAGASLLLGRQ